MSSKSTNDLGKVMPKLDVSVSKVDKPKQWTEDEFYAYQKRSKSIAYHLVVKTQSVVQVSNDLTIIYQDVQTYGGVAYPTWHESPNLRFGTNEEISNKRIRTLNSLYRMLPLKRMRERFYLKREHKIRCSFNREDYPDSKSKCQSGIVTGSPIFSGIGLKDSLQHSVVPSGVSSDPIFGVPDSMVSMDASIHTAQAELLLSPIGLFILRKKGMILLILREKVRFLLIVYHP
ncbi:hypothetical protein QYF36_025697 [Acer negundo]|nr:hypothetical protein QYF36_025697 [Acer negundo]